MRQKGRRGWQKDRTGKVITEGVEEVEVVEGGEEEEIEVEVEGEAAEVVVVVVDGEVVSADGEGEEVIDSESVP